MNKDPSPPQSKPKSPLSPLNLLTAVILVVAALFFLRPGEAPDGDRQQPVLFTLGGDEYRAEDLPLQFGQPLYQTELNQFRIKERIVAAAALELYLQGEMEKNGETREQVIQRLFPVSPPDEAKITAFYQQNQERIQRPLDQAREDIVQLLQAAEQQAMKRQLLAKLVSLDELSFHLQPPKAPFNQFDTEGFPAKGPADAQVTLVEFADYQCPHCQRAHAILQTLLPDYLDRVRYVYMDFPVNRSGISRKIAEAAVCADQQGRFWEFHDLAYANQDSLALSSALSLAQQLNLDMAQFRSCFHDPKTADKVRRSEQQAVKAGVTGTPAFFINGIQLTLRNLEQELPGRLDQALQNTP